MNRDYVIGIPAVQVGMEVALTGSAVQSMVSDVATLVEYSPSTVTTLGLTTLTWDVE